MKATKSPSSLRAMLEQSLKHSEQGYAFLYDNAPVMMHSIDGSGRILTVTNRWLETFGYTRSEVIGRKSVEFLTPESRKFAEEVVIPRYLKVGRSKDIPYHAVKKDGTVFDIVVSGFAMMDENGTMTRSLAVSTDVTERNKIEAERDRLLLQERAARIEAQKSVKVRDDFISILSHELRTPITPLKIYLRALSRFIKTTKPTVTPKMDRFLETLIRSENELDHLAKLIEDLLDVSRINIGEMVLQPENVDLTKLVAETIQRHKLDLERKGYDVHFDAEVSVIGNWDPTRIRQMVSNLLSNAMKYGLGKPIDIKVEKVETKAKLVIRDRGIGIQKENQAKIFERFERLAPIENFGGLGLGLYIVQGIVSRHGGSIQVESELGNGSTFIVELPLQCFE